MKKNYQGYYIIGKIFDNAGRFSNKILSYTLDTERKNCLRRERITFTESIDVRNELINRSRLKKKGKVLGKSRKTSWTFPWNICTYISNGLAFNVILKPATK